MTLKRPGIWVAMGTMIIGQVVMVMLMAISPLHMRDHHHELASIPIVITAHT